MANPINTVTIKFNDNAPLLALQQALEMQMDMQSDMFTDEAFLQVKTVREMAQKSDDEIRAELSRRDKIVFTNLDKILSLQDAINTVNAAIDESNK